MYGHFTVSVMTRIINVVVVAAGADDDDDDGNDIEIH